MDVVFCRRRVECVGINQRVIGKKGYFGIWFGRDVGEVQIKKDRGQDSALWDTGVIFVLAGQRAFDPYLGRPLC